MEIKDLEIVKFNALYQSEDANDLPCTRISFEVDEKLLIENLIGMMGYSELLEMIEDVAIVRG